MEILKLLKENKNTIYNVISVFEKEKENEVLKKIIHEAYIYRFYIKEDTNISLFMKNISIYSIVSNMDIEERENIIGKLKIKTEIDINDEDLVYKLINLNYAKLSKGKAEVNTPKNLESIIENYFYRMKKERKVKYARGILTIGVICMKFII